MFRFCQAVVTSEDICVDWDCIWIMTASSCDFGGSVVSDMVEKFDFF